MGDSSQFLTSQLDFMAKDLTIGGGQNPVPGVSLDGRNGQICLECYIEKYMEDGVETIDSKRTIQYVTEMEEGLQNPSTKHR